MANWPSRVEVKLPDSASGDLDLFVNRIGTLSSILSISQDQEAASRPDDLLEIISETAKIELAEVRRIFNTFENLMEFYNEMGSYDAIVDRLAKAVAEPLKSKLTENRTALVDVISKYNRDNPVSVSYKAQRLTYLRNKLFHEAEIITDSRPIFDESGERILEVVVTHELVVTSLVNREFKRDHFSIDNGDILALRKACDRAIVKSETVKRTFGNLCKVEVLRDDTDA